MDWAERIDTMANGYCNAAVLLTAYQVGLFDALAAGGRTPTEMAPELELDPRALDVVMHALAAAGILQQEGERFALVPETRPYLLADGAETMTSIMGHRLSLMRRWSLLEDVLRSGEPIPRAQPTERELRNFICGMENVSRRSSRTVAERIDLSGAARLLDLGGGPGTAALTFARRNPDLQCVVFDLPDPVKIAVEQIEAAGLQDRVTVRAGDFHSDDLGEGFDVVYISNIIHSLAPEQTLALLQKSYRALVDGGRVLVKDFFLEDSRSEPSWAALFSVNMLVSTERGKSYTRSETLALLAEAGFGDCAVVDIPVNSKVITGRKR